MLVWLNAIKLKVGQFTLGEMTWNHFSYIFCGNSIQPATKKCNAGETFERPGAILELLNGSIVNQVTELPTSVFFEKMFDRTSSSS